LKDIILSLTWVDYLIIVGLTRGAFVGYRDGLLKELLRIFLYVLTLALLVAFSNIAIDFVFENTFLGEKAARVGVLLSMTLATYWLLKIIMDLILRWAKLEKNLLFSLLGLFAGVMRWVSLLSVVFMAVNYAQIPGLGDDVYAGSVIGVMISEIAPTLVEFANGIIPQFGFLI
jgi:uncharacterized membrane protein required for colicin V production